MNSFVSVRIQLAAGLFAAALVMPVTGMAESSLQQNNMVQQDAMMGANPYGPPPGWRQRSAPAMQADRPAPPPPGPYRAMPKRSAGEKFSRSQRMMPARMSAPRPDMYPQYRRKDPGEQARPDSAPADTTSTQQARRTPPRPAFPAMEQRGFADSNALPPPPDYAYRELPESLFSQQPPVAAGQGTQGAAAQPRTMPAPAGRMPPNYGPGYGYPQTNYPYPPMPPAYPYGPRYQR